MGAESLGSSGHGVPLSAIYNSTPPTPVVGQPVALQVDSQGNLLVNVTAGGTSGTQYTDPTTNANPTGTVAMGKNPSNILHALGLSAAGNLNVNLAEGTISGGNAAASATGAAVPASADYQGVNIGGNLVGVTGLALGATTKAPTVAIVDGSGNQITSFGGGTQFADDTGSGAAPVGTLSMGWDSANSLVRALKVDTSQNLNVNVQASAALSVTFPSAQHVVVDSGAIAVTGTVTANQGGAPWSVTFPSAQHVIVDSATLGTVAILGTVTSNQGTNPWIDDPIDRAARLLGVVYGSQSQQIKQTATNFNLQVELATGGTLYDARQIRALTSADVVTAVQGGAPWSVTFPSAQHVIIDSASLGTVTVQGTVTANQGGAPWSVTGNKAANSAAPTSDNMGALVAVANAAAPIYTEGDQVLLSTDLSGNLRISGSVSASNPAVGPTGSSVPAQASYTVAKDVNGNLAGV